MLLSTNTIAQPPPQEWFWTIGAIPQPPDSWHTPYRTGIGKSISTPTFPFYIRHIKHWPAFLVQSQNPLASNNVTRAIIRIQDKRYEEENDSTALWAGEPQIQFWSNEYHTQNEWWMGSIQGVSDIVNQNTNIF